MMPYLTGESGSKGGLKTSEVRLWPSIQAAVKSFREDDGSVSRWKKLYRIAMDGTSPVKVDLGKIGFCDYYMAEKAFAKRVAVRIPKGIMGETFELHQHYNKHEYTHLLGEDNRLLYCPSCGAFGFAAIIGYEKPAKTLPLLPSDFTSPVIFYLPELMGYLPAEMRKKLGSYLKAVGYGRVSPAKLAELEAMMENQDA
jgi:hypothetical protein